MRLLLSFLAALTLACSGCKSTDTNNPSPPVSTNTVQTTTAIVFMSAQLSCYYAIGQDTNAKAYFQAAVILIQAAIASGDYNPTNLATVLKIISINGAKSDTVYLATVAALNLYRIAWADAVSRNLDQTTWVKPILVALKDGIQAGLNDRMTERRYNLRKR